LLFRKKKKKEGSFVWGYLFAQLNRNGVGFLEEDGVAPQNVPQGRELMPFPLFQDSGYQGRLPLAPITLALVQRVH
jgi:hypothetical protein